MDATTDPGLASGEAPSKAVESAEDVGSLTGWVTLVKDSQHHNGKVKLVSSRVKLGPSSRRQYMRQWERRRNNDRELQRRKGDGKDEGERDGKATSHSKATLANLAKQMMAAISDEIADDPTGIGFGFGGVEPGVLHAHGLLHEVHKVSYAIGLAGEYFLHVRLRQQALPVPGSPFKLTVLPGTACAGRSVLPPGPVRGKVGSDNDCASQTLRTSDQVGNECIAGGANVTVACSNEQLTAEVLDNGDGTYTLRWASKYSGTFKTHVRIDGEDVQGSPTDVVLVSSTPDLVKSDLDGAGLRAAVSGGVATFRIKFVDQYLNVALPGPSFKFGLALDTEKRKLSQVEPMDFDGVWEPPGDTGVYQISYWAVHAGMSALHIWCDPEAKGERIAFPGSPFTVHVAAGEASASASRVDGWTKLLKEEKSLSTKASATADSTIIYAGDTLQIRPQIFDAYGNAAVLGEELLSVYHEDANGERSTMAVSTQTRSGQTTYDVRYEVTVAGPHLIHVLLGGQAILGSPLSFYVKPDKPEPPLCKLVPPVDPLFPDTVHTTVLETYDKFGNQCDVGGLPLSNRLQLMKQGVHDQTTLVPANHTLDFEDKKDGTYHILVSTAMPCVVRLFVNLDKNLPSNQGELPPHTFHIADPNKPAMPGGGLQRQGVVNLNIDDGSTSADSSLNASGSLRSAGSPNNSISATGSNGKGSPGKKELKNDRLRAAAGEMMLGFGIAEERRDKDAIFVAAEAFADGADTFKFDEVTASAAAAASASASPIAALFDKKPSGQGGSVKRRSSCLNAASSSGSSNVSK